MKDWDPPLLNQPSKPELLSLEYFRFEAAQALKNHLHLEALLRVAALRKTCGVEPQLGTVNVRVPARYSGASK